MLWFTLLDFVGLVLVSSRFPSCCIAMEIASQLEEAGGGRGARLEISWAPRTVNTEADDLTNEIFDRFSKELRVDVSPGDVEWKVLKELMETGVEFELQRRADREARKWDRGNWISGARKRVAEERLKFRDPW